MKKKRVVKTPKMTTKKGCFLGKGLHKLTPAEKDVLFLLTQEFLTPKQIQIRRECSRQAVSKILRNLKKKGAYNIGCQEVVKSRPTSKKIHINSIRLHGQEFNIKLLFQDYRYKKILDKSNIINIDGNTIRLFKDGIEVYSGQSFYAEDVQKATVKSFKYWERFFSRLEHDLKVILIKSRSQNIKLVNAHYAEINNELAEESEKKGYRIKVYTTDDGKLWFSIDNSFNLQEAETQHPQTSQQDMRDTIKPYFNDLRDKSHLLPSQLKAAVESTLCLLHETASAQYNQTKLMESILPKPIKEKSLKQERPDYVF